MIRETTHSLWAGAPAGPAWKLQTDQLRATVTAQGAHIVDVAVREGDRWIPVSVDYPGDGPAGYHGATVGRYANRIAGAAFELDGQRHDLVANEGPNQLHGGPDGFAHRPWRLQEIVADDQVAGVVLGLMSPDGDQGFPGRVDARASIGLVEDNLKIIYEARTDQMTVINLTNHLYWNLASGGPLDGHLLQVAAQRYVEVDDDQIPLPGPPRPVQGTRFDCRAGRPLAEILAGGGYDHSFECSLGLGDLVQSFGRLRSDPAVLLSHPPTGRSLAVFTDQPTVQIYTGAHLPADRGAIAVEAQLPPDSPNRLDLANASVRPGVVYRSATSIVCRPGPNPL